MNVYLPILAARQKTNRKIWFEGLWFSWCETLCTSPTMVEHIVHIDGVTGSSPVATTNEVFMFWYKAWRLLFCIYRLIRRQNTVYNHQIWAINARSKPFYVIYPDGDFRFPALFSLIIPIFRGRNQRFIKKCTLLWTIAGYRPQCEVSSKVSQNSVWSSFTL